MDTIERFKKESQKIKESNVFNSNTRHYLYDLSLSFEKILEEGIAKNYTDMADKKWKIKNKELKEKRTLYIAECEQILNVYNHGCMFREYQGIEKDIKVYLDGLKEHSQRVINECHSNEKQQRREHKNYVCTIIGIFVAIVGVLIAFPSINSYIKFIS